MSIVDFKEKIKSFWQNQVIPISSRVKGFELRRDTFVVILIVLVGLGSFGLGKISAKEKGGGDIQIIKSEENLIFKPQIGESESTKVSTQSPSQGMLVASKSGTKYYFPWCSGVARIKEENKVWFQSYEEARSRGLTPASGCQGLQ